MKAISKMKEMPSTFFIFFIKNPLRVETLNVVMWWAHVSWEMRMSGRKEGAITVRVGEDNTNLLAK